MQTIAGATLPFEIAFGQHAAVSGPVPPDTVWLNANESPEGPPPAAREALAKAIADAGRYSHRALASIQENLARAMKVEPAQMLLGNGSSEVLHCALEAFTGPDRPLITTWPTWEMMAQIAAASGRQVVKVPLARDWTASVERLAATAAKYPGGALVHLGNPNNPTSSLTSRDAIVWLAGKLPERTPLVVDEAYIDYVERPEESSAMGLVRERRQVIVTRTFSKLYGLAGARIGFGCAPRELIGRMAPFRENVVSILGARAAEAAIGLGEALVARRSADRRAVRADFLRWLDSRGVEYIPPAANFVLMRVRQPVVDILPRLLARGVAAGRRFDSLDHWMRIAIGTAADMNKVKEQLPAVL